MPVPNFTLVGQPYNVPNWIAPGLGQTPYNPYLLSNGGNVGQTFGGAVVPKGGYRLPMVINGTATAVPNAAVAGLDMGAINPSAQAAAAEAAVAEKAGAETVKRGMLARGAGATFKGAKALGKIALPLSIATAPMLADPGTGKTGDGELSPNARALDSDGNDSGVTDVAKSWMRGNYNIMDWLAGLGSDAYDSASYLWKPRDQYNIERKAEKAQELFEKAKEQGATPEQANAIRDAFLQGQMDGNGQPLPGVQAADELAYGVPPEEEGFSGSLGLGGGDYVVPASDNSEMQSALQGLLSVVAAGKPQKNSEISPLLKGKLQAMAFADAINIPGDYSEGSQMRRAAQALAFGDVPFEIRKIQEQAEYQKSLLDWAEKYAKTGIDIAKVEKDLGKSDMKIHSTRGGFLVETTDGNGNKSLKPISADIFGSKANKKIEIAGNKFDADSPLSHELGILQNLSQTGQLDGILEEYAKEPALKEATKGIFDPKELKAAQITFLAGAAYKNPKFKSTLVKKYTDFMGKAPKAAKLTDVPVSFTDALLGGLEPTVGSTDAEGNYIPSGAVGGLY